ncbi:MAG TPA: universal stress protein [Pyrinomonadaceae bacterium]|jgi:nucleotide-binding universal stress UspA family protein|nr:universal stress protein [Pyrinomonadaceae bacterium]
MKILLAIDGSPCSELAVEEVARRPWPAASAVRVLSVVELVTVAGPEAVTPSQAYYDTVESLAREDVERAASRLRREATTKLEVESAVCVGFAKQIILDESEGWGADLIVVGSHGRGLAGRFLLGSVSQAVAAHAKCSVEIVRSRKGR